MTEIEHLRASLSAPEPPPGLNRALQALWWAGKGQWDRAHQHAQDGEGDPDCDWVHAYLHRAEGDMSNARYWYRRAGRPAALGTLAAEWDAVAAALLRAA